ncbi:MAG: hypothetical protein O3B87_01250 [bacterium]|nr:hypothetical protein [bacterium]
MKKYISALFSMFILIALISFFAQTTYAVESLECADNRIISAGALSLPIGANSIAKASLPTCISVDVGNLGFQIPTLGDILTFAIRAFFAIAGLAALFYMLLGAFAWVTSGGDKDAITAAREKIQAAVVGMILLVAVLAVIWTLEQVIFKRRICLGLSCSVTLPGLIESTGESVLVDTFGNPLLFPSSSTEDAFCCVCLNDTGGFEDRINARFAKCVDGVGQGL